MATYNDKYNEDVQRVLLQYLISDPDAYARCRTILNAEHFDDRLQPAVRMVVEHCDQFKTIPPSELIAAKTGIALAKLSEEVSPHNDWFLAEFEAFAKYKALELAILDGVDLLQKGEFGEVDRRIRDAMTISLNGDMGTDYFADPKARLEALRDNSVMLPTGWSSLDERLFGGFALGTLNILCGGSGAGKSLALQNYAINQSLLGRDVIYFTLELSETLSSLRMDAMLTGRGTKQILGNVDDSAMLVSLRGRGAGHLVIKKLPQGGTTVNHLRAYLKEYQIKTGRRPQVIVVDYLDLLYPTDSKIDIANVSLKDKLVSEELREMGVDYNVPVVTASQFNRSGVDTVDYDHSHIAGGITKINTADTVIALLATAAMKENGKFEMQLLKTRSSSGIGAKLMLHYDVVSMRISDMAIGQDVDRPNTLADVKAEIAKKVLLVEAAPPAPVAAAVAGDDPPEVPAVVANDKLDRLARLRARNKQLTDN